MYLDRIQIEFRITTEVDQLIQKMLASASLKRITIVCAFDNVAVTFGNDESQWFEIPTYLVNLVFSISVVVTNSTCY